MRRWYSLGTLAFSLLAMSCSGKDGSTGAQGATGPAGVGATGPAGAQGATGTVGKAGAQILSGAGAPAASLGADGDAYFDTVTHSIYGKAGGVWSVVTVITGATGPSGAVGATGAQGAAGAVGATGAPGAAGTAGPTGVAGATGPMGPSGVSGPAGMTGPTGPQGSVGSKGDTGPLGGPPGPTGATGPAGGTGPSGLSGSGFLTGTGAPDAALGQTNDVYLDSATRNMYVKGVSGWSLLGALSVPGAAMNGWRWFSFVYPVATGNEVQDQVTTAALTSARLLNNSTNTSMGGVGFHFTDPPSPVNLAGYDYIRFHLAVTVNTGTVPTLNLTIGENTLWGCRYTITAATGDKEVNLNNPPSSCWGSPAPVPATFVPGNVDTISVELPSGATAARNIDIAISNVQLVWDPV